jgi:hypothetical protein
LATRSHTLRTTGPSASPTSHPSPDVPATRLTRRWGVPSSRRVHPIRSVTRAFRTSLGRSQVSSPSTARPSLRSTEVGRLVVGSLRMARAQVGTEVPTPSGGLPASSRRTWRLPIRGVPPDAGTPAEPEVSRSVNSFVRRVVAAPAPAASRGSRDVASASRLRLFSGSQRAF